MALVGRPEGRCEETTKNPVVAAVFRLAWFGHQAEVDAGNPARQRFRGIFASAVVASLDLRSADGRTWFERALGVKPVITTWTQRLHQVVAWIVGMNVMYAVFLTIPLVVARILFLPDNPWVPN